MINRYLILAFLLFAPALTTWSQGVGINSTNASPDESSLLDVSSTSHGVLIPRMTESQRDQIQSPAVGLQVFNLTTGCLNIYVGGWKQICPECDFGAPVASSNSVVCEGGTIQLSSTFIPGATYSWSGPDGFSSSDQNPVIANATGAKAGTYSLTATRNGCTSAASYVLVAVQPDPQAPVASSNSPLCAQATLSLAATEVQGATYSWTGPDNFSSAEQNPSVPSVTSSNAGVYSVKALVNGCESDAATVSVQVNGGGSGSQAFVYSGGAQQFEVPACVFSITAKVWGAGGAGSNTATCPQTSAGGGGGYATGAFSVIPGQQLTLIVGQGGVTGSSSTTYGGGGGGDQWRGSGGGRSGIVRSGVEVITAGAGASAGCSNSSGDYRGGAGGGLLGQAGTTGNAGQGGTQSAGGAGAACSGSSAGSAYQGGSGWAGGGGGYFGGGSGGDCGSLGPPAGGGSSFLDPLLTASGTMAGNYQTPGNEGDSDRAGAAAGGNAGSNGQHGRIVLTW
jgi:hypothetical protein